MLKFLRKLSLLCLLLACIIVPLRPMVVQPLLSRLLERSEVISSLVSRALAAISLIAVKVCINTTVSSSDGRDITFHIPAQLIQATVIDTKPDLEFVGKYYFNILFPSTLFFLEEQLKELSKQQQSSKKNPGNKQGPKGSGSGSSGSISAVASILAAKLKEECNKNKQYFAQQLAANKAAIDALAAKVGITVKDFDIRHLWQPAIKRSGVKIAGGHSTLFGRYTIEKIVKGGDPINKCYSAIISLTDKTGKLVTETKSQFPNSWDGYKIIDTFFENIKTADVVSDATEGFWIMIQDSSKQVYKFFLHNKGIVTTFFPQVPRV